MAGTSGGTSTIDTMMIDVRASTQGFSQDVATMRASLDGTLVNGFMTAGKVLESSLVSAVKSGSTSFLDLRTMALSVIKDISAQATQGLFAHLLGTVTGSGGLGSMLGSLAGLPGRATGGPVSPGAAYVVGERGPELFVPASAGAIAPNSAGGGRDVRVAITVNAPAGESSQAMQRSSRQIASAVRRALTQA